ncbi:MAG TPA: glycosyltransferase family A protein [Clostridia bacterium]
MKFSIVIPTYNNKILLKNTLEALNNQTGYCASDYEVIVVDDGSSDSTEEYIRGINRNYNLKYYYLERCENSCRSRTRNHGLKNAEGSIVAFIDSDIIVGSDYLHELNRCFSVNEDIFVLGNRLMLDESVSYEDVANGRIFEKHHFDAEKYHMLEFRHFLYNVSSFNAKTIMCPWIQTYSCNFAAPKKWLDIIGGFDENFKEWGMEDVEIGYSLYKHGVNMIINSKLEVLHQYHGPRNDLIIERKKVRGYEKNIDYFIEKHPEALKMTPRIAYKFLKGETSTNKVLMEIPIKKVELELRDKGELPHLKREMEKLIYLKDIKPILYDYVEDTDIDIWVQLLKSKINFIRYYPMSKRINVEKMMDYIDNEKKLQKIRDESEMLIV